MIGRKWFYVSAIVIRRENRWSELKTSQSGKEVIPEFQETGSSVFVSLESSQWEYNPWQMTCTEHSNDAVIPLPVYCNDPSNPIQSSPIQTHPTRPAPLQATPAPVSSLLEPE